MLKNKTYDWLKIICTTVLPALSALYAALAGLWGFPYPEAICGTISAVALFIGSLIGISSAKYNKAELSDEDDDEGAVG